MKKKLKFGLWISVVGALAAVILLNMIVTTLGNKLPLKLDLTGEKIFELSDETINVLKNTDRDVNVYYLVENGNANQEVAETIDMYKGHSGKIHFEEKDPTKDPVFVKSFGVDITNNSIIVQSGDRVKVIDSSLMMDETYRNYGMTVYQIEEKLTKAIAYVQMDSDDKVLFTTGHDEIGFEFMKTALENENAEASEIDLKTTDIPQDTVALYIIGPQRDFSSDEITRLQGYLANGGSLNISLDVGVTDIDLLRQFLNEYWGINYNDDVIMETDSSKILSNNPFYVLPAIEEHEITNNIIAKKMTIAWPNTRSLYVTDKPGVESTTLLTTSEKAYSKSADDSVSYKINEGDIQGKHILAAAMFYNDYSKETQTRIVATGTSLYAAEILMNESSVANRDFVRETLTFLRGKTSDGLSVSPKVVSVQNLTLTKGQIAEYAILLGLLPELLILAAGLVVWLRRRHL